MKIAFVDVETTGRDPRRHHAWEIGYILRDGMVDVEREFQVGVPLVDAEPDALRVGRYYERASFEPDPESRHLDEVRAFATALDGAFVVINNPVFDVPFVDNLIARHGLCWTRYYHVADIKSLAAGYLHGKSKAWERAADRTDKLAKIAFPWSTKELAKELDIDPDEFATHTALGDCRLNRAIWDAVHGVDRG